MNKIERKLIGYLPVDSGQMMIGDPCYIKSGFDAEHKSWDDIHELLPDGVNSLNDNYKNPGDLPLDYHGACVASCSENSAGLFGGGSAACVRTGYGDGHYPVYVEYSDEGAWGIRVKSVTIEFLEDGGEDAAWV